jgi:hypothetical protein
VTSPPASISTATIPAVDASMGLRVALSLIAGRAAYRIAFQAASLALLAAWGTEVFGTYAAALGVSTWLVFIGTAAEKAVLKTLPRSRLLVPAVVRICLVIAGAPTVVGLAVLGVAAAVEPGSRLVLYSLAAVWCTSSGLLFVVAALHRLAGRPERDRAAFLVLAVVIGLSLAVTWGFDLTPAGQLAMIDAAALALVVVLGVSLPGEWLAKPAHGHRRAIRRSLLRSTWLLGVYELAAAFSASLLYAVLAMDGQTKQTGLLYVALLVSGTLGNLLMYLLRIAQPGISLRLRGTGAVGGRDFARRLLVVSGSGGIALPLVLAAYRLAGIGRARPSEIELATVTAIEIVLYTLLTYATFLVENTDASALRITAGSAAAGLAITALLSSVLIPAFGVSGAMATLGIATAIQAAIMRIALRRHYGAVN